MTSTAFGATKTATVNGTTLAYREEGAGQPVVFVHGTISDMRPWEQQPPLIGASYRAITYSRRYARPNEDIEPGADDQMMPHVDDLAAFLREIERTMGDLSDDQRAKILGGNAAHFFGVEQPAHR
jgi:pimeloyl-ACP methyl ester carboxylesterase